jgi:hypothetical protein
MTDFFLLSDTSHGIPASFLPVPCAFSYRVQFFSSSLIPIFFQKGSGEGDEGNPGKYLPWVYREQMKAYGVKGRSH